MADQAAQISQDPVLIVNRDARIRQYVIVTKTSQGEISHQRVVLKPGANRLDRATYDSIKNEMQHDIDRDNVYQLTKPIASLPLSEQVSLVKMTADRAVLGAFAAVAKAAEVLECIKEKIAEMNRIQALLKA